MNHLQFSGRIKEKPAPFVVGCTYFIGCLAKLVCLERPFIMLQHRICINIKIDTVNVFVKTEP